MKLAPMWHWRAQYSLGLQRQLLDDGQAPLPFLRADRVAHAIEEVVERTEEVGNPRGALLGEHELQVRVPVERAADDEVREHVVRPPRDLEQEHHDVLLFGPADGARAAAVVVDRHAELLAHRPDRVVVLGVERQQPGAGGCAGEEDAAGEPVAVRPADLLDRRVDVVQQDLRDAGAASRRARRRSRRASGCAPAAPPSAARGRARRRAVPASPARPRGRTAGSCSGR